MANTKSMDKYVVTMAVTRLLFGLINLIGVYLMFRYQTVEHAQRVNGFIGSIGPFVFMFVSGVGVLGMAGQIPATKLLLIVAGIILIWLGTGR